MASKTARKTMDVDAYSPINVLNPILTSLSTDKQLRPSSLCPMANIASNSDVDVVVKCPVDHSNSEVDTGKDNHDDSADRSSSSSSSTTIDYLQLAEDVDKWLESQLD